MRFNCRSGIVTRLAGFEQIKERTDHMDDPSWPYSLIKSLFEVIKTGVLLTDNQGDIRFANRYADDLFGYPQNFLNGKSIATLFLPEDTRILVPNILKLTRENNGFEGEALLCKQNGSPFFVNLSSVLYRESSTGHEFIIFTFQDISHFKRVSKEQLDSERFIGLGMITDQISHQIRNPIASIGGFALRLAKDRISQEEYHRYTEIIQSEAKRLETIINRLVEFAHVHPGRYSAFFLSEVFEEVKKAFKIDSHGKDLGLILPDSEIIPLTQLYGDPALISRAVQCVVQNGLEAGSNHVEVTVTWEMPENQVLLRIKDNGQGILPENLPFVFDPFFTTKFNCLGLGLTMARRIVEVHQGRINVESVPAKGTEVSIVLPKDRRREVRTRLL
jgi:PAS domain S-box-containing protein